VLAFRLKVVELLILVNPRHPSRKMVGHVETVAELDKIFKDAGGKAVLIDFHATWCPPCRAIAPELEKLAGRYPNVVVLKVDVDIGKELAQKYGISAMPTFKLFVNGQEVDSLRGASPEKLEELFKKAPK